MKATMPFLAGATAQEQAAAWFARARGRWASDEERAQFEAWLESDAEYRAAYDQVTALWSGLDAVRADPAVLAMREQAQRSLNLERFGRALARTAALALVFAGAGAAGWLIWRAPGPDAPRPVAVYSTRVGQTASIALPDGSLAILDTDTALSLRNWSSDARRLELVRGRAFFRVVKDRSRPFVVTAAGSRVTAVGTAFDVYVRPDRVEINLVEGRLRVRPRAADRPRAAAPTSGVNMAPEVDMTAGYRMVSVKDRWSLARADVQSDTRWTSGRLVFDNARLGDIAAELNRYSPTKISITDPDVADRRMTAVLGNTDTAAFLAAIQAMGMGRAVTTADGQTVQSVD